MVQIFNKYLSGFATFKTLNSFDFVMLPFLLLTYKNMKTGHKNWVTYDHKQKYSGETI